MQQGNKQEREQIEHALSTVTEFSDNLFDSAPVMMHSINRDYEILKVNRRWLTTMGYHQDEVLGQKCVDFLTDESRVVAIQDALPLLWQAGSARSIGVRFVRKNGRVLNVLVDTDVVSSTKGDLFTWATLRTPDSPDLWRQASTTLRNLRDIYQIQRQLESFLLPGEGEVPDAGRPTESQLSPIALDRTSAEELLGTFAELGHDISLSLSALSRVHEDWRDTALEQQDELLLAIKSIDKTLIEIKDVAADVWSAR